MPRPALKSKDQASSERDQAITLRRRQKTVSDTLDKGGYRHKTYAQLSGSDKDELLKCLAIHFGFIQAD
jgi:hypothetical protein